MMEAQAAEAEARAAGAGAAVERERQGRQAAEQELTLLREQLDGVEKELVASCDALRAAVAERGKDAEAASARCMELEEEVVGLKAEAGRLQSRVESVAAAQEERAAQAAEAEARAAGAGAALERERQGRHVLQLELKSVRNELMRLEADLCVARAALRDCAAETSQGIDEGVRLGIASEEVDARAAAGAALERERQAAELELSSLLKLLRSVEAEYAASYGIHQVR